MLHLTHMDMVRQGMKAIHESMNDIFNQRRSFPNEGEWETGVVDEGIALTGNLTAIDLPDVSEPLMSIQMNMIDPKGRESGRTAHRYDPRIQTADTQRLHRRGRYRRLMQQPDISLAQVVLFDTTDE